VCADDTVPKIIGKKIEELTRVFEFKQTMWMPDPIASAGFSDTNNFEPQSEFKYGLARGRPSRVPTLDTPSTDEGLYYTCLLTDRYDFSVAGDGTKRLSKTYGQCGGSYSDAILGDRDGTAQEGGCFQFASENAPKNADSTWNIVYKPGHGDAPGDAFYLEVTNPCATCTDPGENTCNENDACNGLTAGGVWMPTTFVVDKAYGNENGGGE
jgi:hypothetical protein